MLFDNLKIQPSNSFEIRQWSERTIPSGQTFGEVLNSSTLDFFTHKPEFGGLFCERIFGPIKDWCCHCGLYNGNISNYICEECGVELTESRIRRYRMGYINLNKAYPHFWYFLKNSNYLLKLLNAYLYPDIELKQNDLLNIIYLKKNCKIIVEKLSSKIVIDKNININDNIFNNNIITNNILIKLIEQINLSNLCRKFRELIINPNISEISKKKILDYLKVSEIFYKNQIKPINLFIKDIPVLPPTLRPLVEVESGKLVSADINEIYKLIIERNNIIFENKANKFLPINLVNQSQRILQETLDALFDNNHTKKKLKINNRVLRSFSDNLEGKFGRFRNNLLGKRVDFSARSVIVVEPKLLLSECGLPFRVVSGLLKPYLFNLINELILESGIDLSNQNINLINFLYKNNKPILWELSRLILPKFEVLLNRAPTLHKYGIQSFKPKLSLGKTIKLHPLVCAGFNADFDGDQMAIHLPLYNTSKLESSLLVKTTQNFLNAANFKSILQPNQDIILGLNYLTLLPNAQIKTKIFNYKELLNQFFNKQLSINDKVLYKYFSIEDKILTKYKKLNFKNYIFFKNKKEILVFKKNINKIIYLNTIKVTSLGRLLLENINTID